MPRRASRWILHDTRSGWDLSRGGRYLYTGLSSRAEALARLRNYYRPGEPIFVEASDGFRTNITDQLRRSRLI